MVLNVDFRKKKQQEESSIGDDVLSKDDTYLIRCSWMIFAHSRTKQESSVSLCASSWGSLLLASYWMGLSFHYKYFL